MHGLAGSGKVPGGAALLTVAPYRDVLQFFIVIMNHWLNPPQQPCADEHGRAEATQITTQGEAVAWSLV
jgi:hypothetical protein